MVISDGAVKRLGALIIAFESGALMLCCFSVSLSIRVDYYCCFVLASLSHFQLTTFDS